ncbi:MAG: DsrE family protein [Chloroflexi bacterium]|nr:DsrE family protein [Chloroflexota bacterium]
MILTLFLSTSPYSSENSSTVLRLAEAALSRGHQVNLFASGDGVHNFVSGQHPSGLPNAPEGFERLISKGLRVELCGTCLRFRGIKKEDTIPGSEPSSLAGLMALIKESDHFLTFGF